MKELYLYVQGPQSGVNMVIDESSLTALSDDIKWRVSAYNRIEKIRNGDLTVTLQSDKPLSGVKVKLD